MNPDTRRLLPIELRRRSASPQTDALAHQADGQGRGAGAARADGAARRRGRGRRVKPASHDAANSPPARRTALRRACACARRCCRDLDFVGSVEQDPANRPFITPWERIQHEGAVRFPGLPPLHHRGRRGLSVGRLRHPAGLPQPAPLGRAEAHRAAGRRARLRPRCVRLLAQMAFRDLGAHRFWLDVKAPTRARRRSTAAKASSWKGGCARACAAATASIR